MGASDDARSFEAPNRAAAEKMAADLIDDDRFENGNSYSGTIGMADGIQTFVHPKPLTTEQANAWIFGKEVNGEWEDGKAQKWGPAILVNIKSNGNRKRRWYLGAVCSS